MNKIRTRIAPSPTGMFHVGGLRTALFSYLFSKSLNGTFIIRVEDTDRERFVEGSIENMLDSLLWANIPPDEGVSFDKSGNITQLGTLGPYIQSERLSVYKKYSDILLQQGNAYFCFCSKERINELREFQRINKQPTGYDGYCRLLSSHEVQTKIDSEKSRVVRLKIPDTGTTTWHDLVRGEISFENKLIDDQVLLKADGFPTYHFAVVVDDHLMEISHVFRGEEWVSSTPKHLILYKMFGWNPTVYGHLSLLVNEKKQKFSKRNGDVSVSQFREKGYLPEALLNFVALLGWNPGTEQEIFTLDELIKEFSFDKVHKAPAVFNYEKLDWINKQWIKRLSLDDLTECARPFFENLGLDTKNSKFKDFVRLGSERATTLDDIPSNVVFLTKDLEYDAKLLVWKKTDAVDGENKLTLLKELLENINEYEWIERGIEDKIMAWIKENDFGVGNVLWPLRVALSGQEHSPGPFQIMEILGREKSLERVGDAIKKLSLKKV